MLIVLISLLISLALCTDSQTVRILFENSTTYLPINKLIGLTDTDKYSLSLISPKSTPNIKTQLEQLYQEFNSVTYTNESFVDSFGFRIGNASNSVSQIVMNQDFIYLYNLSMGPSGLALKQINKWGVNALVNKEVDKYFVANSTTTAVKTGPSTVEFIMIVVQNGTVNEVMVGLQLTCNYNLSQFNCSLGVTVNIPVLPMYFRLISNTSQGIRCESNLIYLNGQFGSITSSGGRAPEDAPLFYFARFCQMSQLSYIDQQDYSNEVQIYGKTTDNQIQQIHVIMNIYLSNSPTVPYKAQVVDLVEFNNMLILFNVNATYIIQAAEYSELSTASQWFLNTDMNTGFVECQQNDYQVMSCYQNMYTFNDVRGSTTLIERLLMAGQGRTQEGEYQLRHLMSKRSIIALSDGSYFTEFVKTQNLVFRIPPIALNSVWSNDLITSINLNFLVFRRSVLAADLASGSTKKRTELRILQRGTSVNLGKVLIDDQVIAMRSMGPNFMMYHESDIGLTFKLVELGATRVFTASIYTIQLPYFKIEAGPTNRSSTCFNYLKDCQYMEFNFTYTIDSNTPNENDELNIKSIIVPYFHLNQNFSSAIPKFTGNMLDVEILRDQFTINLTDIFYGLVYNFSARNQEYNPLLGISNYNVSMDYEEFSDFSLNLTSLDSLLLNPGEEVVDIRPYITRYTDGSFYFSVTFRIMGTRNLYQRVAIAQLPDRLDSNSDADFAFSLSNLQIGTMEFRHQDFTHLIINNEQMQGMYFYLFYREVVPDNFTVAVCVDRFNNAWILEDVVPELFGIRDMKVRIFRSSASVADDCLIYFNTTEFHVYHITYNNEGSLPRRVMFNHLLTVNIHNNTFEWPVGEPISIRDVSLLDFNTLFIDLKITNSTGVIQEIMQIHQCDFFDGPNCYYYTFVDIQWKLAYLDPTSFNFYLLDVYTLQMDFYRMTDFQREFMNIVKKELKPSIQISLKKYLQDSSLNLSLGSINITRAIQAVNNVFAIPLIGKKAIGKSGFLIFDASNQIHPVRFAPNELLPLYHVLYTQNSNPNNYPWTFAKRIESNTLEIILLNPSSGFSVKSPQHSNEMVDGVYQTEIYELILQKKGLVDFVQIFKGSTKYNFNFDLKPIIKTPTDVVAVGNILSGFVQNLSIFCSTGDEGFQYVTRNYSTVLSCPDTNNKNRTFVFTPYLMRDFDFVPNNYESINSYPDEVTNLKENVIGTPGNVTDFFRLKNSNEFVFLLHNNISIVKADNYSRVLAFINVFDDITGLEISMTNCLSIDEGVFIGDTLEIELICLNPNYTLYNFTVNFSRILEASTQTELQPMMVIKYASCWKFANILLEQYVTKFSEIIYMGGIFYVLDSILVESYNNKPYLNAYQMQRIITDSGRYIELNLIWSSLSLETFANFNISKFTVVKTADETETYRSYSVIIVMTNQTSTAFCFTNVTVADNFDIKFSLSEYDTLNPDLPFTSFKLFPMDDTVYLYGITRDTIQEWMTTDYITFSEGPSFKYSMVCEDNIYKQVFRFRGFFLLYCYNSTSDGMNDDTMLIYNTELNSINGSSFYPIQQQSFPDVDYPSNNILSVYDSSSGLKMLMASTRSFITQYTLNSNSFVRWSRQNNFGTADLTINLAAENVLSSTFTTIDFRIIFFTVIEDYVVWLFHQFGLVIVVAVYLLSMILIYNFILVRQKKVKSLDKSDEEFINYYEKIMRSDHLRVDILYQNNDKYADK